MIIIKDFRSYRPHSQKQKVALFLKFLAAFMRVSLVTLFSRFSMAFFVWSRLLGLAS